VFRWVPPFFHVWPLCEGLVMRRVLLWVGVCIGCVTSSVCHAQASAVGVEVVVCGPASTANVSAAGRAISCGTDANGNALAVQTSSVMVAMDSSSVSQPVEGGEQIGADIGAAVLLVLSVAFCFRSIRDMLNSSSEG